MSAICSADRMDLLDAYVFAVRAAASREASELLGESDEATKTHGSARLLLSVGLTATFRPRRLAVLADLSLSTTKEIIGNLRSNGILGDTWIRGDWLDEKCDYQQMAFVLDALCGGGEIVKDRAGLYRAGHPPKSKPMTPRGRHRGGRQLSFQGTALVALRRKWREGQSIRWLEVHYSSNKMTVTAALAGREGYRFVSCDEPPISPDEMWHRKTGAKLDVTQADEIRAAREAGESIRSLAERYEVDDKSVRQILQNQTYRSESVQAPAEQRPPAPSRTAAPSREPASPVGGSARVDPPYDRYPNCCCELKTTLDRQLHVCKVEFGA